MNIEWIVSSSALILAVLALRGTLGKRTGARLRYALWAVVLLRLLVPVQMIPAPAAVELRMPEALKMKPYIVSQTDAVGTGSTEERAPVNSGKPAACSNQTGPVRLLNGVWISGSTAMALVIFLCSARFYTRLRRSRRKLAVPGRNPVYVSEGLPSPCLFGLFWPTIYVTPGATTDKELLRCVLAHENTHLRHGDHVWNALRALALAVHWWNPLVWLAAALSRQDGELACDEGAIRRLGDGERNTYGKALLSLAAAKPPHSDFFTCVATMSGGKRNLRERVRYIAATPKRCAWAIVAAVMITLLAASFAFAKVAIAPETVWVKVDESGAVWKSGDRGKSWEAVELPHSVGGGTGVAEFLVPLGNSLTIAVAGDGSDTWTMVSQDGGNIWETLDMAWLDYYLSTLDPEDFGNLPEGLDGTNLSSLMNDLCKRRSSRFYPMDAYGALTDPEVEESDVHWDVPMADGSTLYLFATKNDNLYVLWESTPENETKPAAFYNAGDGTLYSLVYSQGHH